MRHQAILVGLTFFGCATIGDLPAADNGKGSEQLSNQKSDYPSQTPLTSSGDHTNSQTTDDSDTTPDIERDEGDADDRPDACREFGYYGDGTCDDFCLRQDIDCVLTGDTGEEDEHPSPSSLDDGACNRDYEALDPDCEEDTSEWTLNEGYMTVCSRFSLHEHVQELAESICIEAPPEHFEYCVESCLERYRN